jgi:hypothetical protein
MSLELYPRLTTNYNPPVTGKMVLKLPQFFRPSGEELKQDAKIQ